MDAVKSEIIVRLFEVDAVKFGHFILKSKTTSPVYIDFRGIISSPDLMVMCPKAAYVPVHVRSSYAHRVGVGSGPPSQRAAIAKGRKTVPMVP